MSNKKIHAKAKRLHTHRIVFTAQDDVEVALRGLLGQSTDAIVAATKLTKSQVQYRITKAGINRWDFRHGRTPLALRMIEMGRGVAKAQVDREITPRFEKLAPK